LSGTARLSLLLLSYAVYSPAGLTRFPDRVGESCCTGSLSGGRSHSCPSAPAMFRSRPLLSRLFAPLFYVVSRRQLYTRCASGGLSGTARLSLLLLSYAVYSPVGLMRFPDLAGESCCTGSPLRGSSHSCPSAPDMFRSRPLLSRLFASLFYVVSHRQLLASWASVGVGSLRWASCQQCRGRRGRRKSVRRLVWVRPVSPPSLTFAALFCSSASGSAWLASARSGSPFRTVLMGAPG
jgi:hypothetical protein